MVDAVAGAGPESLPTAGVVRRFLDASAEIARIPSWTVAPGEVYLPGEWLEGIVLAESSGNPKVRRYEPHLDRVEDGDEPNQDDGDFEDDASWGPMQVLGLNIRKLIGLAPMARADWRRIACNWTLGVPLGLEVLRAELRAVAGDVPRALARYNGGPTGDRPGPDGKMRRAEYVERVLAQTRRVRQDRALPRRTQ
jgi:hypothetical protein